MTQLKYFSSEVAKSITTGGSKLMSDMQSTISNFLVNEKINYKEYNFKKLRNVLHLIYPNPSSKYLIFGFLGNPFFNSLPLVALGSFFFCFVALKKRIAREKFFIITIDLIGWQNALWSTKNDRIKDRLFWGLENFLEKILISHVADEIISIADSKFLRKTYGIKKIHDIEFLEYHLNSQPHPTPEPNHIKVLYAGDLGGRRGFDIDLIEKILINLNNNCELLLVARGLDKVTLDKFKNYNNFHFLGEMPAGQLDIVANECQFGLILYSPRYFYYNIAPPIKLSFYLANGLTIISTNLRRVKDLNDKYNFGYVFNEKDLISFLNDLSNDKIKQNDLLRDQILKGSKFYNALVEICC